MELPHVVRVHQSARLIEAARRRTRIRLISDVPFAEDGRSVPGRLQHLAHRRELRIEASRARRVRAEHLRPSRIAARHQRRSRRRTNSLRHIEVVKRAALLGEPFDIRRRIVGLPNGRKSDQPESSRKMMTKFGCFPASCAGITGAAIPAPAASQKISAIDIHSDCRNYIGLDTYSVIYILRSLSMPKPDSLQGSLDLLVLKILSRRPRLHGYAIMSAIEEISDEVLRVEEGSLYPALHRMEEAGWIHAEWVTKDTGRRARTYELTSSGKKQLAAAESRWQAVTSAVSRVLRMA